MADIYDLVWSEDDATTKDPDHDTLARAARRLTGYQLESLERWARENGGHEDRGDAEEFRWGGWRIVEGYRGASRIFRRKGGRS